MQGTALPECSTPVPLPADVSTQSIGATILHTVDRYSRIGVPQTQLPRQTKTTPAYFDNCNILASAGQHQHTETRPVQNNQPDRQPSSSIGRNPTTSPDNTASKTANLRRKTDRNNSSRSKLIQARSRLAKHRPPKPDNTATKTDLQLEDNRHNRLIVITTITRSYRSVMT